MGIYFWSWSESVEDFWWEMGKVRPVEVTWPMGGAALISKVSPHNTPHLATEVNNMGSWYNHVNKHSITKRTWDMRFLWKKWVSMWCIHWMLLDPIGSLEPASWCSRCHGPSQNSSPREVVRHLQGQWQLGHCRMPGIRKMALEQVKVWIERSSKQFLEVF